MKRYFTMEQKEAKEFIIGYLDGNISDEEKSHLTHWIKSSETNAAFYAEVKDTWEATIVNANKVAGSDKEWQRFKSRIQNGQKQVIHYSQRMLRTWQSVAALLVLLLSITGWFLFQNIQHSKVLAAGVIKTVVPIGEKSQVILPDGTVVWINSGSELTYPNAFGLYAREVLLKGEAYFEVTKNAESPFRVMTKDCQVKVLGTRFNVKSYDENSFTETALAEGSVALTSNKGQSVVMEPGQVVVTNSDGSISFKTLNVENLICWKDHILRFDNAPLADVVSQLERWYGVNIEIHQKDQIEDRRFTFTIKTETLGEILKIFQLVNPITYNITGDTVSITFVNN
ncbi:MAG: DUF4974 domain-containing protein [Marinilabiliaceae bacterium]|nr:DUF4974 domain-containing protein [Marinilabiliaceae bacterium]